MTKNYKQAYQERYKGQLEALNLVGFYKLAESKDTTYWQTFKQETTDFFHLGTVTYAIFYNPETKEVKYHWDTDWDREGLDGFENEHSKAIRVQECPDEVVLDYENQIPEYIAKKELEAKQRRLENGICAIGDTIEIFKGRKLPKGSIKVISKMYEVDLGYGRSCIYARFEDGTSTNVDNCKLVKQA